MGKKYLFCLFFVWSNWSLFLWIKRKICNEGNYYCCQTYGEPSFVSSVSMIPFKISIAKNIALRWVLFWNEVWELRGLKGRENLDLKQSIDKIEVKAFWNLTDLKRLILFLIGSIYYLLFFVIFWIYLWICFFSFFN